MSVIFVFGSNESGIHGAGAAHAATKFYGAVYGHGFGPTGHAWAIPTKDWNIQKLKFKEVRFYVDRFLSYAEDHPKLIFHLTKIGCGLAGFSELEISSLFTEAPMNVHLIDDDGKVVAFARDWHHTVR